MHVRRKTKTKGKKKTAESRKSETPPFRQLKPYLNQLKIKYVTIFNEVDMKEGMKYRLDWSDAIIHRFYFDF